MICIFPNQGFEKNNETPSNKIINLWKVKLNQGFLCCLNICKLPTKIEKYNAFG